MFTVAVIRNAQSLPFKIGITLPNALVRAMPYLYVLHITVNLSTSMTCIKAYDLFIQ
jgi:hypothetical protein